MNNYKKIRPVNKDNISGKYKILFSTPQTKNSNIPIEFRGLQIYNNKSLAEEALKKRKKLTHFLLKKRVSSMKGNQRAIGNKGGDRSNLIQYNNEVKKFKNAKIKRAKDLYKEGFKKTEILRIIINEFKLDRDLKSRSWPKWLCEIN
tara:strand:- start:166 stop:606 length:441 start_codon:yes stop_codon:yes gene_type:complete